MNDKPATPCEYLEVCPFFNDKLVQMPSLAGLVKTQYCKNKYADCARYIIMKKLGREHVPNDLYPNDTEKAERLLEQS